MASEQFSSGPGLQLLTPRTLSSRLVPNPLYPTPVASLVLVVVAPDPADSTSAPSSISVDQDAPSPEPNTEESSSRDVIPSNVHSVNQPPEHLIK
uniref:Uncharacterized protein n=1 Tax=Tanacetum cinerariifolium TaxID=118510 RepID=A0A6L2K4E4_TANCI|nr:hypothetical protein [Tanacetum cinerariifolium]